jgi:colicin import membrane protein
MAKKSPVKSGSKKKTAPKKKGTATKKTATKPKSAAKSKPAGKTTQSKPKKATGTEKAVSPKELIMKKFDTWKPDTLYTPPEDNAYLRGFSAPPMVAEDDRQARDILARKFDFDFAKVAGKAPSKEKRASAKAAKKVKPVSQKELIMKKFDTWKPETLFSAPHDETYLQGFSAPPMVAKDNRQTREILARKFDFDFSRVASKTPPKAPKMGKPVSQKELIMKRFETWKPDTLYSPPEDAAYRRGFSAPPMVTEDNRQTRDILARKFDFDFEELGRKAAEEKAAAERAAAEKKAAEEKPAAEKAAAKPIKPKPVAKEVDPMEKTVKYLIVGVVLLFTLIIAASYSNSKKYYIQPSGEGVEIRKGKFAPLGTEKIAYLPGVSAPEPAKKVYSKDEALPLVFTHYVNRAEGIMAESAFPNLEDVKSELDAASEYAINDELRASLDSRMTDLNLLMYLYKADIAASKGNLTDALDYLQESALLKLNEMQSRYVEGKIEMVTDLMEGGLTIPPEEGEESIQPETLHEKKEAIEAEKPEPKISAEEAVEEGRVEVEEEGEAAEAEEDPGVDLTPIEKPRLPAT